MGFVDKPHLCNIPMTAHGSVAKIGAYFECDHCKVTWKIQSRVRELTAESMYKLTWTRREGDYLHTRSWQDG